MGLNSDAIKVTEPKKIFTSAAQGKVVDFACGEEHGAFVDSRGNAHTFGFGQDGQLGHGEKQNINTPKRVQFDKKVRGVSCGGGHTGLITTDGELYLMGRGRDGQLGRGDNVESIAAFRAEPTPVEFFTKENLVVEKLALGSNHSIAVASKRVGK